LAKKNPGKEFEAQLQKSCQSVGVFYDRIKDTPPKVKVGKNKYDYYIYQIPNLFALELKSTGDKSISFSEKIIKQHQIDNLTEAATHKGIIAGFIFNYREYDNATFFVHITEFNKYKLVAQSTSDDHTYVKVNKSSIPLEVCEQIGIKINNYKMRTNYHYHIKDFIDKAVSTYSIGQMNENN
jgi:penicillin-binding protein-related factor A (putative recombinase)